MSDFKGGNYAPSEKFVLVITAVVMNIFVESDGSCMAVVAFAPGSS